MDFTPLAELDALDAEALKALVMAHRSEIAAYREQSAAKEAESERQRKALAAEIDELRRASSAEIERLKLMIKKLQRLMFGPKSEKIVVQLEQLELKLEELETARAEMETAAETIVPAQEAKARPARKPLPEHLPRQVVTHVPESGCCPDCGGALRQFGEDVSEQLEYIPESFKVIRHVRPKFACSGCDRVVEAPAPSRPDRARTCRAGAAGACAGFEVLRITYRSIASRRFMRARAWRSIAPRWPVG